MRQLSACLVAVVLGGCPPPAASIDAGIVQVSAGAGLRGGGGPPAVMLEVDFAVTQQRVTGTCAAGFSVRAVNADGSVVCAPHGLTVSCGAGSALRTINADGTTVCEPVAGGPSALAAGEGLTGGGDAGVVTLAVDFERVQHRVVGACDAGASIRAVNADGTVACHDDAVGTPSTITAGTGLLGGGSGSVTLGIAPGGVGTSELAAGAVTMSKTAKPSGHATAALPNGATFVYPATITTDETAGTCMVTASALFLGSSAVAGFRVRPVINNANNQYFVRDSWGYSAAVTSGVTLDFPNGVTGRQAATTAVLDVNGPRPWTVGCEVEGNQSNIICTVSYQCD